jgi:predicted DNA-binding protein (MmcQ/YjbR family)
MSGIGEEIRSFALHFPEAHEDFPWGESVVKVRKKVFVFLGRQSIASAQAVTVKLVESHEHALAVEGARPTGYGLGKAGWVTVPVAGLELEVLCDWVEESYRIVAPKRLVAELDRSGGG